MRAGYLTRMISRMALLLQEPRHQLQFSHRIQFPTDRLMEPTRDTRQLSWFLAWAVVFCDIGTSVYYVPGILYGNVGNNTPFSSCSRPWASSRSL